VNWGLISLTILTILAWGIGSGIVKIATNFMGERAIFWDAILYFLVALPFFFIFFKGDYEKTFHPKGMIWAIVGMFIWNIGMLAYFFN
jgi:hypothetical protein